MKIKDQALKFVVVGGLNTLVGYFLFALFIFIGMSYPLALFLATTLGVLFNFKTTGKIVFDNSTDDTFFRFVAVYIFIYLFNMLVIKLICLVTPNLYLAGFIALIPTATIAFILNKLVVFKEVHEIN